MLRPATLNTQEESGVVVHLPSVRYVASQPWPFPRSLMIGFYACAKPAAQEGAAGVSGGGSSGFDLLGPLGRSAALDVGIRQEEVTLVGACGGGGRRSDDCRGEGFIREGCVKEGCVRKRRDVQLWL